MRASAFNQSVSGWDVSGITSMVHMFRDMPAFNNGGVAWSWGSTIGSTANVTLSGMFENATSFNADISSWIVSNVTSMDTMFSYAAAFDQDMSSWDVSAVTNMASMFSNGSVFNNGGSPFLWGAKTANVNNMSGMFNNASVFNQDIRLWDVSSVLGMSYMFNGAVAFNNGSQGLFWGTGTASVTNMIFMFNNASAFSQDISGWNVSAVTSMNSMFNSASAFNNAGLALTWTNGTGTAFVTDMGSMFDGASSFNVDISTWNVSAVTTMSNMFNTATLFNSDISAWNVSAVTSMSGMFNTAYSFNNGIAALTWSSGTGTANVTDMNRMFFSATSFNSDISGWDVSLVSDMTSMFLGVVAFNYDIRDWSVSSTVTLTNMFSNATAFQTAWYTPDIYIGYNSGTGLGNSTPLYSFFNNTQKLVFETNTTGIVEATSPVENGSGSFTGVTVVEQTGWPAGTNSYAYMWTNTVTSLSGGDGFGIYNVAGMGNDTTFKVTQWGGMVFSKGGSQLRILTGEVTASDSPTILSGTSLVALLFQSTVVDETSSPNRINNISNWDVSNVTDMNIAFTEATAFNEDISSWDVSAVTSMNSMFNSAKAFNNGGATLNWITGTGTANVILMSSMFQSASAFNQDISTWNVSSVTSMAQMFQLANAFNNNSAALTWSSGTGTANVTSMGFMFNSASAFSQDISGWNVSAVTSMNSMFREAVVFNNGGGIAALTWTNGTGTSNVTDMSYMFRNAYAFNQDISTWNVSLVTDMQFMFSNTSAFDKDIGSWDVSSVTSMYVMFSNAQAFNNGGAALTWTNGGGTVNVINMNNMFNDATSFDQDISTWNVSSVTTMSAVFYNASVFNQDIRLWDVSSVTNMWGMFGGARAFNNGEATNTGANPLTWGTGTANVTDMTNMFGYATTFNQDISSWNVSAVTDMSTMFNNSPAFNYDIRDWVVGSTVTLSSMFSGATAFHTAWYTPDIYFGYNSGTGLGDPTPLYSFFNNTQKLVFETNTTGIVEATSPVENGSSSFTGVTVLEQTGWPAGTNSYAYMWTNTVSSLSGSDGFGIYNVGTFTVVPHMGNDTTFKVTQWGGMVFNKVGSQLRILTGEVTASDSPTILSGTSLAALLFQSTVVDETSSPNRINNISNWDVSNVTDMNIAFTEATAFNEDISSWDVSAVTSMNSMFNSAKAFNNGGATLNWITGTGTANVILMSSMFQSASAFNQDISTWNVSSVTSMAQMFQLANAFNNNSAALTWSSGTGTANVTSMGFMFNSATSFNADINSWNVSNVTTFQDMFYGALIFNKPLNSWVISSVTNLNQMFRNAYAFNQELSSWVLPSTVTVLAGMFQDAHSFNNGEATNTGANPLTWSFPSSITNLASLFQRAWAFNQDISSWNVSTVTRMTSTLNSASAFNQDISGWNVSSVTSMNSMFDSADSFDNGGVALTWAAGTGTAIVTDMANMFKAATAFNQDISSWNTSANRNFSQMFAQASLFNYDISGWDFSYGNNFQYMFNDAVAYDGKAIYMNLTSLSLANMFLGATQIAATYSGRTGWNGGSPLFTWFAISSPSTENRMRFTSSQTNMTNANLPNVVINTGGSFTSLALLPRPSVSSTTYDIRFEYASGTTVNSGDGFKLDGNADYFAMTITNWSNDGTTSTAMPLANNGRQLRGMGGQITATDKPRIDAGTSFTFAFYGNAGQTSYNNLENWDIINVTDFSNMFLYALAFDQDLSGWGNNTVNVVNMNTMFRGASAFNQDISSWNVSSVTSMSSMFMNATSYNNGDPANNSAKPLLWTTNGSGTGNVTDMNNMFRSSSSFNQDIGSWDVSNVTNMSLMFFYNQIFNSDISSWVVSSVTDMNSMFSSATSFNQDISEWDVSSATNMNIMFSGALSFSYDIRKWAVDSGCVLTNMFQNLSTQAFGTAYYNKYPGWAASISVDTPTYRFFNETTILKYRANGAYAAPVVNTDGSFVILGVTHDTISDGSYTTATAYEYTFTDGGSTVDGLRIFGNATWQNNSVRDIISWGGIPLARNGNQLREYDGVVTSSNFYPTILSNTSMSFFLYQGGCSQFDGIDSWNVSNVTSLSYAFGNATNFNKNIGSWQVKNVIDMTGMFDSGSFNQPIFAWQLDSITDPTKLDNMFNNNSTFDQDIRVWSVPTGTFNNMFLGATAMAATYQSPGGTNPDPDFATSPTQAFFGQDQLSYMEFTLANTLAVSAPTNIPIITADGSFSFLNLIEQSDVGGLKTWRINFMFVDNGTTNDGFSLNKTTSTDFTSMTILSWNDQDPAHPYTQSMPLSRAGSQFKGLTGGITAQHPEIPKILNNTSGDSMFENSTVTSINKLDVKSVDVVLFKEKPSFVVPLSTNMKLILQVFRPPTSDCSIRFKNENEPSAVIIGIFVGADTAKVFANVNSI